MESEENKIEENQNQSKENLQVSEQPNLQGDGSQTTSSISQFPTPLSHKLEEERIKKMKRAERFGISSKEHNIDKSQIKNSALVQMLLNEEKQNYSSYGVVDQPIPNSNRKRYLNQDGGFGTGIDLLSEEEKKRRQRRIQRFGNNQETENRGENTEKEEIQGTEIKIETKPDQPHEEGEEEKMEMEFSCERRTPPDTELVREDALHVHGTDQLSTENIFHLWKEYSPSELEWINDSSCNIIFSDKSTAIRALYGICIPETEQLSASININSITTATPLDKEYSPEILKGWWKCVLTNDPVYKNLTVRFARTFDVRPKNPKPSRYYAQHLPQNNSHNNSNNNNRNYSHHHHHHHRNNNRRRGYSDYQNGDDDDDDGGDDEQDQFGRSRRPSRRNQSYSNNNNNNNNNNRRRPLNESSKDNMFSRRNSSNRQNRQRRDNNLSQKRRNRYENEHDDRSSNTENNNDEGNGINEEGESNKIKEGNKNRRWKRDTENDDTEEEPDLDSYNSTHSTSTISTSPTSTTSSNTLISQNEKVNPIQTVTTPITTTTTTTTTTPPPPLPPISISNNSTKENTNQISNESMITQNLSMSISTDNAPQSMSESVDMSDNIDIMN